MEIRLDKMECFHHDPLAGDGIWSHSLPSGDQEDGHYQGPNHTLAQLSHKQGSAANHEVTEM